RTDLELVHDDNIFRTDSHEVAGEILHFRPSVTVASDWVNHALSLTLGADIGRYLQHSSENHEDLNGAVSGRIDVDEGETIGLGANVSRGHDERVSLDDIGAPTPTKFYVYGFNPSYVRD